MDKQANIYQIYTENIAPLTPMITEQLKMDEDEYGSEAVAEAIRIAVLRNIRNMKYINGILRNGKNGKVSKSSGHTADDWKAHAKAHPEMYGNE